MNEKKSIEAKQMFDVENLSDSISMFHVRFSESKNNDEMIEENDDCLSMDKENALALTNTELNQEGLMSEILDTHLKAVRVLFHEKENLSCEQLLKIIEKQYEANQKVINNIELKQKDQVSVSIENKKCNKIQFPKNVGNQLNFNFENRNNNSNNNDKLLFESQERIDELFNYDKEETDSVFSLQDMYHPISKHKNSEIELFKWDEPDQLYGLYGQMHSRENDTYNRDIHNSHQLGCEDNLFRLKLDRCDTGQFL